jgi:hypothetical protein
VTRAISIERFILAVLPPKSSGDIHAVHHGLQRR